MINGGHFFKSFGNSLVTGFIQWGVPAAVCLRPLAAAYLFYSLVKGRLLRKINADAFLLTVQYWF